MIQRPSGSNFNSAELRRAGLCVPREHSDCFVVRQASSTADIERQECAEVSASLRQGRQDVPADWTWPELAAANLPNSFMECVCELAQKDWFCNRAAWDVKYPPKTASKVEMLLDVSGSVLCSSSAEDMGDPFACKRHKKWHRFLFFCNHDGFASHNKGCRGSMKRAYFNDCVSVIS